MAGLVTQCTGKYEKSIQEAEISIGLAPGNELSYSSLTRVSILLGRLTEAEATLKRASDRNFKSPQFLTYRYDLAFLKGDWHSRTGLATATGERDLRPNYTLDDKGKGKVSFVQKNGTTCEAPAEARWDGSKLVIEEKANPKCADGRTYARNTVNCEVGADGVAKCTGSQPGDKRSYNVQIGR
jgi:hypothetical protein